MELCVCAKVKGFEATPAVSTRAERQEQGIYERIVIESIFVIACWGIIAPAVALGLRAVKAVYGGAQYRAAVRFKR
jgi:hypothetical protein